MKIKLLPLWILMSLAPLIATANEETVCARNFNGAGGMNPCENFSEFYTYLVAADEEAKFEICAQTRPAHFCESTEAAEWVISKQGDRVCVINYNQKVTGNFCQSTPKSFQYALKNG